MALPVRRGTPGRLAERRFPGWTDPLAEFDDLFEVIDAICERGKGTDANVLVVGAGHSVAGYLAMDDMGFQPCPPWVYGTRTTAPRNCKNLVRLGRQISPKYLLGSDEVRVQQLKRS